MLSKQVMIHASDADEEPNISTRVEDRMSIIKKHLFLAVFCLLFTIVHFDRLHAQQGKGEQQGETKRRSAPALSITQSNVQTAPAVTPAGQPEKRESGKDTPSGGDQPRLTIDAPDYDAGELWEGEDIIHTFTIKNTGKALLDITNVKPG
jgi:hypothetical protein